MKKLIHKIILTCKEATFYSSIKSFKKLKLIHRIQLKFHFMVCKSCHDFDHQSKFIDSSLADYYKNGQLHSDEILSAEKKAQILSTVNQHVKQ